MGLEPKVALFFTDYLVKRKTNYNWNELSFSIFEVDVGVGQGSTLSPILSALYLSLLLYILEKCLKNLKIPISFISFVDDSLIIAQNKSIVTSNSQLFCSYNILSKLLNKFGLIVEHSKIDIFHFNRSYGVFNPLPLDQSAIGGPILKLKDSWKYLSFIFDQKLNFHQHIDFYSNKAILTVKYMKLLGNLSRGINPIQKHLLYRCCILPIALYSFQLWFYNKVPLSYHMKILGKMQRRAAIWILGTFKTSLSEGIEAIAGLIPIKYYLQKLVERSQLQSATLPTNHLIRLLMNDHSDYHSISNPYSINSLMDHQKSIAKGHLINSNNKLYGNFLAFSPLHPEFNPGSRITDKFSGRFSFNLASKDKNNKKHLQQLDKMTLQSSSLPNSAIIVTDASVKNDIATSISHIHIHNHPLTKMVHHAVYVTSTEAELFAIRCGINQACGKNNISKIIIISNSIHAAKKIFESSPHPYQLHTTSILQELRQFFDKDQINSIKFWECPSRLNWRLHQAVDKDSKSFNPQPMLPSHISWDYCEKINSNNIINHWKMTFQASDGKGRSFLNLVDGNYEDIEPSYIKGGPWLQAFGYSNLLCARATRAITNHAPIGEYRLRFFPNEDFSCPCGNFPIESRRHVLYDCKRHNGYWNPRRDSLCHFILFLIANPKAFVFIDYSQPVASN